MNALTGRLAESLDLYTDVLLNPTFPDKELERLRGQTLATIQQEKAQPASMIRAPIGKSIRILFLLRASSRPHRYIAPDVMDNRHTPVSRHRARHGP